MTFKASRKSGIPLRTIILFVVGLLFMAGSLIVVMNSGSQDVRSRAAEDVYPKICPVSKPTCGFGKNPYCTKGVWQCLGPVDCGGFNAFCGPNEKVICGVGSWRCEPILTKTITPTTPNCNLTTKKCPRGTVCHCQDGDACTRASCEAPSVTKNSCVNQGRSWCVNQHGKAFTCCEKGFECRPNANGCRKAR